MQQVSNCGTKNLQLSAACNTVQCKHCSNKENTLYLNSTTLITSLHLHEHDLHDAIQHHYVLLHNCHHRLSSQIHYMTKLDLLIIC